jgi:hypothetical protein
MVLCITAYSTQKKNDLREWSFYPVRSFSTINPSVFFGCTFVYLWASVGIELHLCLYCKFNKKHVLSNRTMITALTREVTEPCKMRAVKG